MVVVVLALVIACLAFLVASQAGALIVAARDLQDEKAKTELYGSVLGVLSPALVEIGEWLVEAQPNGVTPKLEQSIADCEAALLRIMDAAQ